MKNITLNFRPNSYDLLILEKLCTELHLEKKTDIIRKSIASYEENSQILSYKNKDPWEEARKKSKGSYTNISFTIREDVFERYVSTVKKECDLQRPRMAFLIRNALYTLNYSVILKNENKDLEIQNNTTLLLKASIEKVCEMITTESGIKALKRFIKEIY